MLNTTHKRKSAVITAIILLLLIVGIFNYGMQYLDPPVEYGLAINFGTSEVGSGEPVEKVQKSAVTKQEEVVEEPVEESSEEKTIEEEVITDDTAKDVPVIEKTKEKQQPVKEVKKPVKPKKKPAPKPSKEIPLTSVVFKVSACEEPIKFSKLSKVSVPIFEPDVVPFLFVVSVKSIITLLVA